MPANTRKGSQGIGQHSANLRTPQLSGQKASTAMLSHTHSAHDLQTPHGASTSWHAHTDTEQNSVAAQCECATHSPRTSGVMPVARVSSCPARMNAA